MYRISWSIPATNYTGHGAFCHSYLLAQDWLVYLRNKYPDMLHWVEDKL